MTYQIWLSNRAERDLDRFDRSTRKRMDRRLEQWAEDPLDPRLTAPLTNQGGLRKSRVVVTIERRGQVYQRI